MIYRLYPKTIEGTLDLVSSKSASHRYLIAAALCFDASILENVLESDDTEATILGLVAMGASIHLPFVKKDKKNHSMSPITIDCRESGSTLRFLIPLALLLDEEVIFTGKNQLINRPLEPYIKLAKEHGFIVEKLNQDTYLPLRVKGPIKAGIFQIEGHISSQFLTGLIFALSTLKEDSKIILTTPLESKDYVMLTIEVLKSFGVEIIFKNQTITIKGNQSYQRVVKRIEGDFSQSAFWLVAGTIAGSLTLNEVPKDSVQGDQAILEILSRMAADIKIENTSVTVQRKQTIGTHIDLTHTPDLGPILMVLAGISKGETTFTGLSRLKYKESDRLNVMLEILEKLGVSYHYHDNFLSVYGVETFKGGQTFEVHNDHRIAMALCVAALRCDSPILIKDPMVVRKSYPRFYEDYLQVGGKYEDA